MINMSYRRYLLLFIILILASLLVLPGTALAEDSALHVSNNTITIEAPEQAVTGQTLTLVARVIENEYDEPVIGARVNFFIKTDFFIDGLVEIGESVTDEKGLAKIDYIPNQPGEFQIVASHKEGSGFKPVAAEGSVIISGPTQSFYQTIIGIQFPNSFIVWMIVISIIIIAAWSTFLFVIYKVIVAHISRGTRSRGAAIALMVFVTILFIVILLVLLTPEAQYNFGLMPRS